MKFILEHWDDILMALGPIAAWFTGRKMQKIALEKSQVDLQGAEVDNLRNNFGIYQGIIDDLERRFKLKLAELEEEVEKMRTLNEELRRAVANQEKYIKRLQLKLEKYEKLEEED